MTNLEILINIIDGIVESICVSYLMLVLATTINKTHDAEFKSIKTFIKFWLITLITVIINKVIHIFLPELKWLKFINYTVLSTLNYYLCYNIKIYKGAITSALVLVISSILEVIIVLLLKMFGLSPEILAANTYYTCLSACILALLEALIRIYNC